MLDRLILILMIIGLPLDWLVQRLGMKPRTLEGKYTQPLYCGVVTIIAAGIGIGVFCCT